VLALLPAAAGRRTPQFGDKLHKLAGALRAAGPLDAYRGLVTLWNPGELVETQEAESPLGDAEGAMLAGVDDPVERFQLLDTATYLPDDILTKVDRASMAVSLEARVPLLDHRVVEFAWHLPPELKLRHGTGKWLLRRVLARHVPPSLTARPKAGFALPLDSWLCGPLRDWAEALLDPSRLKGDAAIDPVPVRAAWRRHLAGRANEQHRLWAVLMLQAWLEREKSAPTRPAASEAVPA
jgi:asparagine synthase (glutamine-hydrolysing)